VTSLFDLAFRSAKVRSKSRLQSKSEVISLSDLLSERLNENYGLNTDLDPSLAELT